MNIESNDPIQVKTAVDVTRTGLNNYADRIESRIQELESQVELHARHAVTVEDHAEHLDRDTLMVEVSKLTLALLQPLTVVNASVEAALRHAEKEIQKDLLDLAHESGKRMQSLTKRLMTLVGYPVLEN
jgi:signal transduction histidine kinase